MSHATKELYEFGGFRLDVSERLLLDPDGEKVMLTEKVYATLCVLVRKSGTLVRKEDLLEAVWDGAFVEENNLDKAISALRRALGEKRGEKVFIETVRKHGYRFVAEVSRIEIEETASEITAVDELPPTVAAAKVSDTHLYAAKRRNNVLAIADWQPERETKTAENSPKAHLPPPIESKVSLHVVPFAPTEKRHGWSPNRIVGLLIILTLLGGGLAFSVNRFSNAQWASTRNSFEQISFRKLVGSDGGYSPTISPDGKTAAYRNEDSIIWIENLTNGSRIQLKNADEPLKGIFLKFAPDGNYLYYVWKADSETRNAIYRVAVPNGTPRKIVGDAWTGAAVSPDGKQIAFMRFDVGAGAVSLMTINTDGTNERVIAVHRQPNFFALYGNSLAWSPEGMKIACFGGKPEHQTGDSANVIVVDINTGAEFFVPNPEWQSRDFDELTWSADGNALLVTGKDTSSAPNQIWQVSYPQGVWRRITNDLNNYSRVDVSADGKTLITAQEKSYSQLWLTPVSDPSQARQLTDRQTYKDGNLGLAFTPDGERIVYASSESGNYEIWTANADGSNRRQLTFGSESAIEPMVTADNRFIVFIKSTSGVPHLWRMNHDGTNPIQLTNGAGEFYQPAVTPDGQTVIYTAYSSLPKTDLYRISIDGGEPAQLTDKFGGSTPIISPDGKWIAYSFYNHETAEAPWRTAVIPAAGGSPVKTIEMPFRGVVRWTTDSQSLLYLEDTTLMNIWRKPIFGSGSVEQITDFKTERITRFALSPDGKQLLLSRGNIETNIVLIENSK